MKIYSVESTEKFMNRYMDSEGAEATQLNEGCLGLGDWVLAAPNKKTVIIKEVFLNEWASGQTIRLYNKTPKKYRSN